MPEKTSPSPQCAVGRCACVPICHDQMTRVNAFLQTGLVTTNFPKPEPPTHPAPKGCTWFCQVCATLQPAPGLHCGIRIVLIELRDIRRDGQGRIERVTSAQNLGYYRKLSIPEDWQPGQKYAGPRT